MENIVTYRNDAKGVFCQIKLQNGERLFISCTQNGVKMYKLLFGYIPIWVVYSGDLEDALKLFSSPEHWGQSILDLMVKKFVNFKSISEVRAEVEHLRSQAQA